MRIFLGLRNWRRGFCGGVECLISTLSFLAALSVFLWRSEFFFVPSGYFSRGGSRASRGALGSDARIAREPRAHFGFSLRFSIDFRFAIRFLGSVVRSIEISKLTNNPKHN